MSNEKKDDNKNIPIKYKESSNYEIYHADGVGGGWTPRTNLSVDFFVERGSFPDVLVHGLTEEGKLGEILDVKGAQGISRERQCGIIMNVQTAIGLRDWLTDKIEEGKRDGRFELRNNQ